MADTPVRYALAGATLIDGSGAAPRRAMTVVVDGRQIATVAPDGAVDLPADLPVYDLAGDGYSALARPGPTPWAGTVLATAPSVARVHGTRAGAPIVFDQRPIP